MTDSKPNFLFILADDLGYADVSCYGRRDFTTPNIDRLAADGLRFTQAYANSAVCTASRVALMTGRYQYRLAVGLEETAQDSRTAETGSTSGSPHLAVDPEEERLSYRADRQVAFGYASRLRSSAERVRIFLRIPQRGSRL